MVKVYLPQKDTDIMEDAVEPIATWSGETRRAHTPCGKMYVTINYDTEGKAYQTHCHTARGAPPCMKAMSEALSRIISLSLKHGISINAIYEELKGIRCNMAKSIQPRHVCLSCPDAIGKALHGLPVVKKDEESN